jgi:hypothetical protein
MAKSTCGSKNFYYTPGYSTDLEIESYKTSNFFCVCKSPSFGDSVIKSRLNLPAYTLLWPLTGSDACY